MRGAGDQRGFTTSAIARRAIAVTGLVQGVGFRPFLHRLASRLGVSGTAKNDGFGVLIEAEADTASLDRFIDELVARAPPSAKIESLSWSPLAARGLDAFRIEPSEARGAPGAAFVSPDVATCDECLAELFDPKNRRYRYPFTTCAYCGPRLTIVTSLPYDRERTAMALFAMCPACRAEYEDPRDRRFHAEAFACPSCGPRLVLRAPDGRAIEANDALAFAARALARGEIVALKGIGGYHLACVMGDERSVLRLRARKGREEKPFAIMVADFAAAERLCHVSRVERALLVSAERPIVLLRARGRWPHVSGSDNPLLGVMLPYSPLHHLLLRAVGGAPLVMTSGNRSDAPIAFRDDDALVDLGGVADLVVGHDRAIAIRCDDSIARVVAGAPVVLRRSRGHAPRPIDLPAYCARPILAVGGHSKVTIALGYGRHAFLSHHLGALTDLRAQRAFAETVEHYERLLAVWPELVAHDLHPGYASTEYARARAAKGCVALAPIQHHEAHVGSCMAEHGLVGPVIGVAFDGTGLGADGALWGGEFLVGSFDAFRRAAHLRYVAMPGGERAIVEPWRMAIAHLVDADACGDVEALLAPRIDAIPLRVVRRAMGARINTPFTSSVGRLFDAVAVLAGLRTRVSYEGQAAMELEWAASATAPDGEYPFELIEDVDAIVVDARPLVRAVALAARRGEPAERIARRFHATVAAIVEAVCTRLRDASGISTVVLTGGVFMNALLAEDATTRLVRAGFSVHRHARVPPGDGGIALGQLVIAAARDAAAGKRGS